ncbi:GntR family transcriptional regulator [Dongia soli]|uniref:GntR family transcriptional regulator n=1 Tax=Dongia soli TaxID=600628 RepID=A0ABU5E5W7_9PROT|nr:GntR family transcriptional regulator [Dongia soli]MDY0881603.1 GntR family transcriptional regulator [Dongia soli]
MTRSKGVPQAKMRAIAAEADDEGMTYRQASQVDRAYQRLEELIVTLEIAPGSILTEQMLTQMLNIGRTPIREALQRLALEGLVVILPRRGILVSAIDMRSQLELLRLRREVERLMARYAALRCTASERQHFYKLAEQMKQAARDNDDVDFMRLDQELNLLVARACRNEYAQKAIRLMSGLSRRFWYQHYKQALDLPRCAGLHAGLAEAIAGGDGDAAAAKSDALVDYIQEFTRATLEEDNP